MRFGREPWSKDEIENHRIVSMLTVMLTQQTELKRMPFDIFSINPGAIVTNHKIEAVTAGVRRQADQTGRWFPPGLTHLRGFNPMIHCIAEQMQTNLIHLIKDLAISFCPRVFDDKCHFFAGATSQIAHVQA